MVCSVNNSRAAEQVNWGADYVPLASPVARLDPAAYSGAKDATTIADWS